MRNAFKTLLLVAGLAAAATAAHAQSTDKAAGSGLVTAEAIAKFSPRARADLVTAIVAQWQRAEADDINMPLRIQHFMAQIATETGGLRLIEENLNYSASRLRQIFPSRVSADDAQRLAGKPIEIANHVYGGRFRNKPPMDGWNYRGSGLIQLTGRSNFAERGAELKLPLEEKPDMARQAPTAFTTAVAYWTARKVNRPADDDDIVEVRRLINGGKNGLAEARVWLVRAKRAFPGPNEKGAGDLDAEEFYAIQELLSENGLLDKSKSTGPSQTDEAIKKFQESRALAPTGLTPTGLPDEDTLYALTDPTNFKSDPQ